VPFSDIIKAVLADHLDRLDPDDDQALVFTSPMGAPLRHSNFYRRAWLPAVAEAGLPGIVAMSAPNSTAGHDSVCGPCRRPLIDQAAIKPRARPAILARIARRQRSRIPSRRPPSRAKITAVTRLNSPSSTGIPNKKPGPLSRTAPHPGPPSDCTRCAIIACSLR